MCPTIILFLGLLLWLCWSAIGRCFSPSPVVVREVFKSSWTSFPVVSKVMNEGSIFFSTFSFMSAPSWLALFLELYLPLR